MNTTDKKTIFLVDDDTDVVVQMTAMLEKMGFAVVSASGQEEAESMMDSLKIDLAIVDLMMENRDSGFILSHRLKLRFPEMPIIIASALTAETGMMFSVENSCDRQWIHADLYVEKGIRPDQLHREINKLLKI